MIDNNQGILIKFIVWIIFSLVFHSYIFLLLLVSFLSCHFWVKFCLEITVCLLIAIFTFCTKNSSISKFSVLIMTCSKTGTQFFELHDLLFRFCIVSLALEKSVWVVVCLYWMLWITKYTALLNSNKRKTARHLFIDYKDL